MAAAPLLPLLPLPLPLPLLPLLLLAVASAQQQQQRRLLHPRARPPVLLLPPARCPCRWRPRRA
jgi:hypothetical protein